MKDNDLLNASFLNISLAYLEIGRIAASAETSMQGVGEYQNAIAYQLFHAIELFYKYMIKKSGGTISYIHDLKKLEEQYRSLYPSASYALDHPFDFSSYEADGLNPNERPLAEAHMRRFRPAYMSQHLRYPLDSKTGGYSFSLDESCFTQIKDRMMQIAGLSC